MALINCPECGKEKVSDSAEACPECGYPISEFIAVNKRRDEVMSKQATNPIMYCKCCGYVSGCSGLNRSEIYNCPICHEDMLSSQRDLDYFLFVTCTEKAGQHIDTEEEVRIEFIYNNPTYDVQKGKKREQLNKEEDDAYDRQRYGTTNSSIKCPTCGSTNVAPIGGIERGVSVAALGLFSKKINKSFKCSHCGYTW